MSDLSDVLACMPAPPPREAWQALSQRILQRADREDPLAAMRNFLRWVSGLEGEEALTAEVCAQAARTAAVLDQTEEAPALMQQARAWAALANSPELNRTLDLCEVSVLVWTGHIDRGLRIAQRLLQDGGLVRATRNQRLRMLADLCGGLLDLGRFDAAQETLAAGRQLLQADPDETDQVRWTWLELTAGLHLAFLQPGFDKLAQTLPAPGQWRVALGAGLLKALPLLEAHVIAAGPLQAQSPSARLLAVARRIATHCGLAPVAAALPLPPGTTPMLVPGINRDEWLAVYWEAVEALLRGMPREVHDLLRRAEASLGPANHNLQSTLQFLQAAAWRLQGHHRLALEHFEQHVGLSLKMTSRAVQLLGSDPQQWVQPLVGADIDVDPAWPEGLVRALRIIDRAGGVEVKVALLANQVGKSERWLRNAFQTHLQCTPLQWIARARLKLARAQLQSGWAPAGGLGQMAIDLGFSNPGRFRAAYIAAFGESPRDTLRTAMCLRDED